MSPSEHGDTNQRTNAAYSIANDLLGAQAWTTRRLQHARPNHLHETTQRYFIGPIPEGWLKSQRKAWYSHLLELNRPKTPTFVAAPAPALPRDISASSESATSGTAQRVLSRDSAEPEASPPPIVHHVEHSTKSVKPGTKRTVSFKRVPEPDREPEPVRSAKPVRPTASTQRTQSGTSFVTARSEPLEEPDDEDSSRDEENFNTGHNEDDNARDGVNGLARLNTPQEQTQQIRGESTDLSRSPGSISTRGPQTSTTSLLPTRSSLSTRHPDTADRVVDSGSSVSRRRSRINRVRFDHPSLRPRKAEIQLRANLAQARRQRLPRVLTSRNVNNGQVVKMDKMLIRLDVTSGYERPEGDFDEKSSRAIESRVVEKWREYMVVCRETDDTDAPLTLQFYKTRVIPSINKTTDSKRSRQRFRREILLNKNNVKVNLYSSLDKTIVLWTPKRARTQFFFLRPQSGTLAVEWYHFFREVLGMTRAPTIQINIPDLNVNVRLKDPFNSLVDSTALAKAAEGDEEAISQAEASERAVAGSIIERCLGMLSGHLEWSSVLQEWAAKYQLGLAWKRYDRLEWIHGGHERNMYGSMAMFKTHDLELRVKQHYPCTVTTSDHKSLSEPPPVEGFLVRLTTRAGVHSRGMGTLLYKRLYFMSQDQYLIFLKPAKAVPPKPPRLPALRSDGDAIPSAQQIKDDTPLTYAVDPYATDGSVIPWLTTTSSRHDAAKKDAAAADEALRNAQSLLNSDGFINLCDCTQIRNLRRGAQEDDDDLESGSEVDFDRVVPDSDRVDGATSELDDDRTFEIVLRSGLIIRLQAYSKAMKKEWIKSLRKLVHYWTERHAADMELYKKVRNRNLQALNIDERTEAYVGQFAEKWEVSTSFASPELYHACGIASCRTIHVSGQLYRKPRLHGLFSRCHVIVAHGHMIIFRDVARTATGKRTGHIHHDKIATIDLAECYCYSGLLTEPDLLYQNRTFDTAAPGSHSLPRVFLEDRWSSNDDDSMTTFVIWHGQRKGWFKTAAEPDDSNAEDAGKSNAGGKSDGKIRAKIKRVNQLGVKGRSIVFKARSRAERDHWVMAISVEIEKLTRFGTGDRVGVSDDVRVDS